MSARTLTALEALAAGATGDEPALPPLVPEWDGEVHVPGYVAFLESVARRQVERGIVVEVLA